ncbi:hypothetical protein BGZ57DRAFT_359805 [Hyaloscypha finlandica]|nr:hypothetical protein BGZ57DRAFT_359805 [Hyaloscypha finlandica]KAH8782429.1 hypothetical protein F5882DRAFT_134614 [Hyaloscypha sp. PMI_1271]
MSVFSKIMMSRKAAKEAKDHKTVAKQKEEAVAKVPYKHVPTHAAVDALSGAPSTWKVDDRSKIKEHHKRRSQMVISRTGSSLSNVSYMNAAAGPSSIPPLPRNSSYNSYNPTWFDRGGDIYYASENTHQKRQKPSRGHSYHDSGIGPSPLASNLQSEEVSPVVSSGNSTTSNSSDNLEIPVTQNSKRVSQRPQPIVYAEQDIFDRLHTSTTRKLGEAPLYDSPPIREKASVAPVVAQEVKAKKQRWSLLGKKNAATIQT